MTYWDERFREGDYPQDPDPSPVLRRYVDSLPEGRAFDLATGTGRNAVFLAEAGYEVDAMDQSREGLEIARANARDRGVADRINWIEGSVETYPFPESAYDVVTVSYFRAIDWFTDIKGMLAADGVLFVEHHLRSVEPNEVGPSNDRYRFAANELLHACLDLTVLYFDVIAEEMPDGRNTTVTRILARKSSGAAQQYPRVPSPAAE